MKLTDLPTYAASNVVRCVVESPAGTRNKLKYDPEVGYFELSRPLPKGLTYPFDWGFIPSTRAPDDDPIDVMIVHDAPTFPGLLVAARLIGVLEVEQRKGGKKWERNDRLFTVPAEAPAERPLASVMQLPRRVRQELEQFFIATVALEGKELRILGWKGPAAARTVLRGAQI